MPSPNIPYSVSSSEVSSLVNELNAALSSISDRLDKLEGLRGNPEMNSYLTMNNARIAIVDDDGNILHQFGDTV